MSKFTSAATVRGHTGVVTPTPCTPALHQRPVKSPSTTSALQRLQTEDHVTLKQSTLIVSQLISGQQHQQCIPHTRDGCGRRRQVFCCARVRVITDSSSSATPCPVKVRRKVHPSTIKPVVRKMEGRKRSHACHAEALHRPAGAVVWARGMSVCAVVRSLLLLSSSFNVAIRHVISTLVRRQAPRARFRLSALHLLLSSIVVSLCFSVWKMQSNRDIDTKGTCFSVWKVN